jgi:hypothetical protein
MANYPLILKNVSLAFSNHSANLIENWKSEAEDDIWK